MLLQESFRSPVNAKHLFLLGAAILMMTGIALPMGKVALKSSETVERSVPVGVLKRVRISNTGGNVIVTGNPGAPNISISAVKSAWGRTPGKARSALAELDVAVESRGDLVEVRPAYPENWDKTFEVEFFLTVPTMFRVEIASPTGAIQVRNVREADINGGSGDVLLTQVKTVTAKTTSGNVEIGPTPGPIDVTTTSGLVRAQLEGDVRSVRVLTTSGDVTLQVPSNLGAQLGITTTSGVVTTQGLSLRDANQTRFGLVATVNDGGVPIEITSTNGAVTVNTRDIGPGRIRAIGAPARVTAPVAAPAPAPPPAVAPQPEPGREAPSAEPAPAEADTAGRAPAQSGE